MTVLQQAPASVVGFDVAKHTITVFETRHGPSVTIGNERGALRRYITTLDPRCLAVCEPTGGFEIELIRQLSAAGIPIHRADTLKLKAFSRSFGTLAKTDAIDARALARYGQERWSRLALFSPAQATQTRLTALIARRQDLIALKVAETNRLKAPGDDLVKASCKALLESITHQLARIDAQVDDMIAQCQTLRRRIRVCLSLRGVGSRTAIALAAQMPELGTLSRRQAASLAGLAPHPSDSGTLKGYRRMRGGRPNVRASLFMAALAASRADGPLHIFYKRLIDNGKKPIVAISALMRKIIVILNAKLRDNCTKQS